MLDIGRALHRLTRDPRLRVVIALILILLAFALAWHLVGMADHGGMMLGACIAVLAAVATAAVRGSSREPIPSHPIVQDWVAPVPPVPAPQTGRPPPKHGTVLRP